jgi:hypothetical protein
MILLDNSIIFTSIPKIQAALHLSPAGPAWVQDAYVQAALTAGSCLLTACLLTVLGLILPGARTRSNANVRSCISVKEAR